MKLEILQVPDCPNVPLLERRLEQALADEPVEWDLHHRVIDDPQSAASAGMTGSPTLLIDGRDPFGEPGQAPSVSCRLYRDARGGIDGAPSVAALRAALGLAPLALTEAPRPLGECCAGDTSAAAELGASRGRATPTGPAEIVVHKAILRSFAAHGAPPSPDDLETVAERFESSAAQVLGQLHAADVIRLDATGHVQSAYPFSAFPTRHHVRLASGVNVYAMCAIDALGIPAMLDIDVIIDTADSTSAAPITVTVHNGQAVADPATAVVFVGAQSAQGPSADVCCNHLNFFSDRRSAQAWADDNPRVTGGIVDLADATRLGAMIFGPLLIRSD
ncbi:alkylmercury lyase family protein [Rhodococcus opacus]|uniref:Alkylmercury lyase n=1 Tax=Rhodococcus opacus TaxID=37919 RepID=A0A076EZE5_RHOOP|nr:alkylmercury lyase family protein [Rhodococcus opacus]AII11156.1 alkylmercury lyase [Rhodococcus opacus]